VRRPRGNNWNAPCLRKDAEAGPFTARDPVLGRQLYKGRSV
jgi:hypothetical protein